MLNLSTDFEGQKSIQTRSATQSSYSAKS